MSSDKLKKIRNELRLNQHDFADKLGIKQSYYSAIERGKKEITSKVTNVLLQSVGVNADWWHNSNGTIFSGKLLGNPVVEVVGNKKLIDANFDYAVKLNEDLKHENKSLYELTKNISLLSDFEVFIEVFRNEYLNEYQEKRILSRYPNAEKVTYKEYKNTVVKTLEDLKDLKEIIGMLGNSMNEFYADFKEYDTKNILQNHGFTSEDEENKLIKAVNRCLAHDLRPKQNAK